MSGIAGFVGSGSPEQLDAMLAAIGHRGDTADAWLGEGVGLGYRWWRGRPGKAPGVVATADGLHVVCAGTLAPSVANPADTLAGLVRAGSLDGASDAPTLDAPTLDGAFGAAVWNDRARTLTLVRDPFGVRSLYWTEHEGTLWFASELKQLLAVLPLALDPTAIHRYLAFSFVAGPTAPFRGVHRVPTGCAVHFPGARVAPYFQLREEVEPMTQSAAVARLGRKGRAAVERRLTGESRVGLYLSGGIDSAAVAVWLREAGASFTPFHLDFGDDAVDRDAARAVARHLDLPLETVAVAPAELATHLPDLVWALDLPFGDAVTGPHLLLAHAARAMGLSVVLNGEGGDQLFGGWTSKPMVAAALYGGLTDELSPEEQYLQSYHRFYGLEDRLYTPAFRELAGPPGQRRALLAPFLHGEGPFLHQVRLADLALKGSHNILPRAERIGNACGLDVRSPLFDRALATFAFRVPPGLKLHGACEKFVLKCAMQGRLPDEVVWRRKFGMGVPVTDWLLGPTALGDLARDVLGEESLRRRGWFEPAYVASLLAGLDSPAVTRRRRVGEKLWALLMLELWLRRFVDRA